MNLSFDRGTTTPFCSVLHLRVREDEAVFAKRTGMIAVDVLQAL